MKIGIAVAAASVVAMSAASHLSLRAAEPSAPRHPLSEIRLEHAPRTVWDSVYSDAQATRGQTLYGQSCARCHQDALTGADDAPALAGGTFLGSWNNTSLSTLFERTNSSMPSDDPGSLSKQQVADILAYVLRFNNFPVGSGELPTQAELLKEIMIVSARP
jgi:mono/diheme cytochrome c family protein